MLSPISAICLIGLLAASCHAFGEKLHMTIHQAGFHRTIRYQVTFGYQWRPLQCDFALEQTIPAGAYVDTHQLDDLERVDAINYYTRHRPNVELMAHNAEQFRVVVYGDTEERTTVQLPVHMRYHLPDFHHRFKSVTIPPPNLYLDCSARSRRFNETLLLDSDSDAYRNREMDEFVPQSLHVWHNEDDMIPCSDSMNSCPWYKLRFTLANTEPITVQIPVGNSNLEPMVTFLSLVAAWAGAYYISMAVLAKNKELERGFAGGAN